MKHYWINIDECIVRKEFVELQFNERNIPNYRISAVTPSTLFNYNIIMNQGSSNSSPAEISCIISHLLAIKKGYEDGDNYFCITEDDIVCTPMSDSFIEKIEQSTLLGEACCIGTYLNVCPIIKFEGGIEPVSPC